MVKYLLIVVFGLFFQLTANCQRKDTVIFCFKVDDENRTVRVKSIDSCDFFRLILPSDSDDKDKLVNVKEFYKNGSVKLIGKSLNSGNISYTDGIPIFQGNCISFYPNGKRRGMVTYDRNYQVGPSYEYYNNGKLYCVQKPSKAYYHTTLFWTCYDTSGNEICTNGNGWWVIYDLDVSVPLVKGTVKNGHMEGEWQGISNTPDSIHYTCTYRGGQLVSAKSFDKHGNSYSFKNEIEQPQFPGGSYTFAISFKQKLNMLESNGETMSTDSLHYSFDIESDGRISNVTILGIPNPQLLNSVKQALSKLPNWTPRKHFGIPVKSTMTFILSNLSADDRHFRYSFKEKVVLD